MKFFTVTAISIGLLAVSGCAQAGQNIDTAEVEQIIKSYLLKNPEIIREAMIELQSKEDRAALTNCLLYTSPSPRDRTRSRMPSSA